MQYYEQQPFDRDARLTVSSVLLLFIFISAVGIVAAAAIWQPWDGGSDSLTSAPAFDSSFNVPAAGELAPQGDAEVAVPETQ
jgi:hypothetical protein